VQKLDIPVLLIAFNRPDTASKVLQAIRQVKPEKLYIAADGPRESLPEEKYVCDQTRDIILKGIDWDCKVSTLFHNENLGCAKAVSGAIDWFLQNEEMGIILEDDCLPNDSFFLFCRTMLLHHRNNERIMQISGFNELQDFETYQSSYYYSNFPTCWGWATWRRSWEKYNLNIPIITEDIKKDLTENTFYGSSKAANRFLQLLMYNFIGSWDYQWALTIFLNRGICITPKVSLVKNIGFDDRATHTSNSIFGYQNIDIRIIEDIYHPNDLDTNIKADQKVILKRYYAPFLKRLLFKFNNLANR
jgi:hypothetical protein